MSDGWEIVSSKKNRQNRDNRSNRSNRSTKRWNESENQSSPNQVYQKKKSLKRPIWELVCQTENLSIGDCESFVNKHSKDLSSTEVWQLILYRIVSISDPKHRDLLVALLEHVDKERTLDMSNFNLTNALLWTGSDNQEYFVEVLNMLNTKFKSNLFTKNSDNETFVDSLRSKKKDTNNPITDNEYYFRYGSIFSNVNDEQLIQMTKQLLNKLNDSNLNLFTSRYMYLLSRNSKLVIDTTIETIVGLRQEKLTKNRSPMIHRCVRMINLAIEDANNRYRNKQVHDSDLTMYFKENMFGIGIVGEDDLYQQIVESICDIGFANDIAKYKQETYELASALLGEFAKTVEGFVDTFMVLLSICCGKDTDGSKYLQMDTDCNLSRITMRGALQFGKYTDDIKNALQYFKDIGVSGSDKFLLMDITEVLENIEKPKQAWT